jgi:hypothetical protein
VLSLEKMASIASVESLNDYLRDSKAAFFNQCSPMLAPKSESACLHVVMGNESLDLDSIVSSILLAYLYHHHFDSVKDHADAGASRVNVIPLLPIDRRDFNLRTEAVVLLSRVGVDLRNLLFVDDLKSYSTSVKVRNPPNLFLHFALFYTKSLTHNCILLSCMLGRMDGQF